MGFVDKVVSEATGLITLNNPKELNSLSRADVIRKMMDLN
jgi:enoyl-CoA hydratase/carnithine racemase